MAERVFTQCFVVVGALIERDGKFLLVREGARKDADAGKYNTPAGWVEVGEEPLDAVRREVEEETGYQFTPAHLLGVYSLHRKDLLQSKGATPHPFRLIYLGNISAEPVRELADDVSGTEWLTSEEIQVMDGTELRDIDIKKIVADYQAGRRFPLDLVKHTVSEAV